MAVWRRMSAWSRTVSRRRDLLRPCVRVAPLVAVAAVSVVAAGLSRASSAPLGPSTSLLVWSGWDIFAMSPTGKAEKPLTTGKCVGSGVQWAPDRSRVYVGCLFEKPGRSVVAYAGPAGPAEPPDIHDLPVVLPYAAAFAIAPDGRIAFESRDLRIHVANADGSRQRRISSTVFHHEVRTLGWSADSSHVFVDNCAKYNGPTCVRSDLMSIPVSGGPARVLFSVRNVFHLLPAGSSRQSKKIAFSVCRNAFDCKLAIANADGTGYRDLTDWRDGKVFWPCWSPDGSRIAFVGAGFAGDGKTKQDTPIHIITPTGKPVATIPIKRSPESTGDRYARTRIPRRTTRRPRSPRDSVCGCRSSSVDDPGTGRRDRGQGLLERDRISYEDEQMGRRRIRREGQRRVRRSRRFGRQSASVEQRHVVPALRHVRVVRREA